MGCNYSLKKLFSYTFTGIVFVASVYFLSVALKSPLFLSSAKLEFLDAIKFSQHKFASLKIKNIESKINSALVNKTSITKSEIKKYDEATFDIAYAKLNSMLEENQRSQNAPYDKQDKLLDTASKMEIENIEKSKLLFPVLNNMPIHSARVTSKFGYRRDPFHGRGRHHNGIDLAAPAGTPIKPLTSGFVVYAARKGAYGNVVEIQHSKNLKTRYAHLKDINVKKGQVVRPTDIIATVGSTGRSTGPHLHLEVINDGKRENPELFFEGELAKK